MQEGNFKHKHVSLYLIELRNETGVKAFFPTPRPSGKLALAFQTVGWARVIGQRDCGHEQRFYKPKEPCEVTESSVRDSDGTAQGRSAHRRRGLRFQT